MSWCDSRSLKGYAQCTAPWHSAITPATVHPGQRPSSMCLSRSNPDRPPSLPSKQVRDAAQQVFPVERCVDPGHPNQRAGHSTAGPCLRLRDDPTMSTSAHWSRHMTGPDACSSADPSPPPASPPRRRVRALQLRAQAYNGLEACVRVARNLKQQVPARLVIICPPVPLNLFSSCA